MLLRGGLLIVALALGATAFAKDEPELKLLSETKLATLLQRSGERFEASAVYSRAGEHYVLFDNRRDVAVVSSDLSTGKLLPIRTSWRGADYEGLTYDARSKRFFAVIEAERTRDRRFHARLIELDPAFKQRGTWSLQPEIPDPGKGAEGLAHVRRGKKLFLLVLLEGNHGVGGKKGKDKGNGRVRVYGRSKKSWSHVATLKLPKTARLSDYAGIDVRDGRIAVVSQKTSKLWVGELDPKTWKVAGPGTLYRFPRPEGVKIYESVEAVTWLTRRRLLCASDGARSKDGLAKSESLHVVELP